MRFYAVFSGLTEGIEKIPQLTVYSAEQFNHVNLPQFQSENREALPMSVIECRR